MKKINRSRHDLQGQLEFPFLIDFPTSELWQDHYERLGCYGIRPRKPGPEPSSEKLAREMRLLREENADLFQENRRQEKEIKRLTKHSSPIGGVYESQ